MGSWLTRFNQKDFNDTLELYEKGNLSFHNKKYDDAIANYLDAAECIQAFTTVKCVKHLQYDLEYQLSLSYFKLENYSEALFMNDRAETTAISLTDDAKIALILDLRASINQRLGLNRKAIDQFKQALNFKRLLFPEDCLHIVISCHHICNTYINLNKMDEALLWYRKAIDIQNGMLEDRYIDLSYCYLTLGEYNINCNNGANMYDKA